MTRLANTAEGGTNGVGVTAGNSGGASGDAFDLVGGSGTSTVVFDDDAPAPLVGTMSLHFTVASGETRYVGWTSSWHTDTEEWTGFFIYKTGNPTNNTTLAELAIDAIANGPDMQLSSTGAIRLRDGTKTLRATSSNLANDTLHRVEWRILHSDTVGRIEGRIFSGANALGETPDETLGSPSTSRDTNASANQIRIGVLTNPGAAGLDIYFDDLAIDDVDWIGPPASGLIDTDAAYTGVLGVLSPGVTPDGLSEILVPTTGALLGAVVAAADASTSSTEAGLTLYNSMSGIRPPQIIGVYKVGNWDGTFSTGELAMFADAGGGDPAIPHVRWKVGTTGSPNSWASVAAGDCDSVLDAAFAELAAWPGRMFISIFHEPEDDAGPAGYSNADFVAMWEHCKDRADAQGATNLVWGPNFMGYYGHIDHVLAMMPAAGYCTWVWQDPYAAETASRDTLEELVNWDPSNLWGTTGPGYDGFADYMATEFPELYQGLAEWGIDGGADSAHGVISAAAAIPIIEEYQTSAPSFLLLKAFELWHADGVGDYQWTDRGGVGVTEYVAFTNDAHFDQDTNFAYD